MVDPEPCKEFMAGIVLSKLHLPGFPDFDTSPDLGLPGSELQDSGLVLLDPVASNKYRSQTDGLAHVQNELMPSNRNGIDGLEWNGVEMGWERGDGRWDGRPWCGREWGVDGLD